MPCHGVTAQFGLGGTFRAHPVPSRWERCRARAQPGRHREPLCSLLAGAPGPATWRAALPGRAPFSFPLLSFRRSLLAWSSVSPGPSGWKLSLHRVGRSPWFSVVCACTEGVSVSAALVVRVLNSGGPGTVPWSARLVSPPVQVLIPPLRAPGPELLGFQVEMVGLSHPPLSPCPLNWSFRHRKQPFWPSAVCCWEIHIDCSRLPPCTADVCT